MRTLVAAAVACVTLASLSQAGDAQAAVRKSTNIPAQALEPALQSFAQDRQLYIIYAQQDVITHRTAGATGELTRDETLKRLLGGTGLTYQYLDDKTVTVLPIATAPAATSSPNLPSGESAKPTDKAPLGVSEAKSWWQRLRLAQAETSSQSSIAQSSSFDASAKPSEDENVLFEIVVTAQKREERLQDVPISIAVLSGNSLDEPTVQGVSEALSRVPGVISAMSARAGGNTTQVVIRGVGPQSAGSSTAGYYLDSIPFGFIRKAYAPDASPFDLDRIEVLRGPQGTLYGASALNGVVRILTKDANLDAFEMKARASTSSTDHGGLSYRSDMALNVPIVEGKLAARAVVGYQDLSGWIDKPIEEDANDAQISNFRLKVNAQPTDQFSVGLQGWFSRADSGAPPNSPDGRRTTSVVAEPASNDYDAFSAKLAYGFSAVTLTSATSYIDFKEATTFDYQPFVPGAQVYSENASEVLAQEMTLNSNNAGPWRWSLGGIYRDVEDVAYQDLLPSNPRLVDSQTTSESFAFFGEIGRSFSDGKFEVTAGLRRFEDEVGDTNAITGQSGSAKFDATTPRLVLTWHPSDQATVYASYGEGFRSGLSQSFIIQNSAPNFPDMKPDTLTNYELGAKGSFWSGRGAFETAVFFIDWQDVQQSLGVQVSPSVLTTALVNGESASGVGFEAAVTLEPVEGLTLTGSFSWNDLELDSDVFSLHSSGAVLLVFSEGDRLSFSPETTAAVGAEYRFALGGNGFAGRFSVSANYISEQTNRVISGMNVLSDDGDNLLTGRVSFRIDAPEHWSGTLFVDNFGNENGVGAGDPFLDVWDQRLRPRTMGLQFDYRFE